MESSEDDANSLDLGCNGGFSSCMSEKNDNYSPHTPGVQYDFDAVREVVEALLADSVMLARMSPLAHLKWALSLPLCMGLSRPPELLARAAHRSSALGSRALQDHRRKTLDAWLERKRVLDPMWRHLWESLPPHVRDVLGPKKNLQLLRDILVSAGHHDNSLVEDLAQGFPLIGQLSRSGALPWKEYSETLETRKVYFRCMASATVRSSVE